MTMLIYDDKEICKTPYTNLNVFSYAIIPHSHTFFEFAVILAGECQSSINGLPPKTLTVGDVAFARPGDIHTMHSLTKDCLYRNFYVSSKKMKRICAAFSDDFLDRLMQLELNLFCTLDIIEHTLIERKAAAFAQTVTSSNFQPSLDFLHTTIITQLLNSMMNQTKSDSRQVPEWLKTLYLHLSSFHYVNQSVNDIIKTTGYSHSYVCKIFKEIYGITLLDCLNKSKVILSTNYLGQKKIIDIALFLGWQNPKNYVIAFKKVFNMTPREYIKTLASKETSHSVIYSVPPKINLC